MKEGQEERVFSLCTGSSWFIHGSVDYTDNKCMYIKEASDYEKLYSLNVLGVEDRGEDDHAVGRAQ